MRRTTITLPDQLATVLQREAQRRRVSVSEVVRRALETHFGLADGQPRRLPFADLGRSGEPDIAERVEEIIAEEWDPRRDR
jgi:Arc/MetJ-type ribon-helix-helix transcriptional regulator